MCLMVRVLEFERTLTFSRGGSADIIGRRFAFNTSLFLSAVFAIVAGASPNWIVLGLFVSLAAFGGRFYATRNLLQVASLEKRTDADRM